MIIQGEARMKKKLRLARIGMQKKKRKEMKRIRKKKIRMPKVEMKKIGTEMIRMKKNTIVKKLWLKK
jgi:hypothetical protein